MKKVFASLVLASLVSAPVVAADFSEQCRSMASTTRGLVSENPLISVGVVVGVIGIACFAGHKKGYTKFNPVSGVVKYWNSSAKSGDDNGVLDPVDSTSNK